jgi:hypothetical protein
MREIMAVNGGEVKTNRDAKDKGARWAGYWGMALARA